MPFIDLNKHTSFKQTYDYTIIGAGAVGILMATKLNKAGFSVALLESGILTENEEKQNLNEVEQIGKHLNTAVWGRKRAVGGTTIAWGGQSLPFSKLDFKLRDWVSNSGWDITYEEMASFYNEANSFMNIDNWPYGDEMLKRLNLLNSKPKSEVFDYHVSKWSNTPNFAISKHKTLKRNVDVYYNAQVIKLNKDNSKIISVTLSNFNRKCYSLPINKVIIANGGLESIRLLLLNNLSNSNLLGKGFMEHPSIELGYVKNYNSYLFQQQFNTHYYKGKKYSLRLSLSEKFQSENKLLNASVAIMFDYSNQRLNPYKATKELLLNFKLRNIFQIVKSIKHLSKTGLSYLKDGFLYKPNSTPKLSIMLEQAPSDASKVYLSNELDQFLQKKIAIDWQISDMTTQTLLKTIENLYQLFKENNLGELEIYPHLLRIEDSANEYFSGVNHHMGGAKLGSQKENSIVNTNLKLWNYDNIFVCSSAVFPTSSHSNPTLTLLALACRLSKFLIKNEKN